MAKDAQLGYCRVLLLLLLLLLLNAKVLKKIINIGIVCPLLCAAQLFKRQPKPPIDYRYANALGQFKLAHSYIFYLIYNLINIEFLTKLHLKSKYIKYLTIKYFIELFN